MYKSIIEKIKEFATIIIHRHSRPDGDALGSQIGLREILKQNYPDKEIYAVGDKNQRLSFMGEMDDIPNDFYSQALVIVLDTADASLISDERYKTGEYLIKIDHHIERQVYADLEIIDTSFESCASLVSEIAFQSNLQLNKTAAQALFTGIVTDSGRFRYDSVSVKTFEIAGKLLGYGFELADIYNNLYVSDLKDVRLRSFFTLKFKVTKNNVAYIMTDKAELEQFEIDVYTASRGMVNTMSGIRGIDIWVNFTEDAQNNLVIAEIRSSKYNINKIATKYGGGGHRLASGASLRDFDEASKMLEDLDNLVLEESNE